MTRDERDGPKNILFIKTHKCASTTIQDHLLHYASAHKLKVLSPNRHGLNDAPYAEQPFSYRLYCHLRKPFNVNINHSPYEEVLHKFIPHSVCITSVREPLSRAISHYYSFIHRSAPIPFLVQSDLDFNEYYLSGSWDRPLTRDNVKLGMNNYMSRWLGYQSEGEITEESLRNRFQLIGVQEDMEKTTSILGQILSMNIKARTARRSTSREYLKFSLSEEVRDMFESNNQADYKLHGLAYKILKSS